MTTQKPYKKLKTIWPVVLMFVASLILLQHLPAQADEEAEFQMRELVKTAGSVPDAIVNPPMPVTHTLSVGEWLGRFWREKILGFRITYASARGKVCHANQRVIAGAVEMYNMDKGNALATLRHADATTPSGVLVTSRYLKSPITLPETNCEYCSYGDLTCNGIVYCTQHGTTPEYLAALLRVTGLKPRSELRGGELGFFVVGLTVFFFLTAMVLLALFFKTRKPAEGIQSE
ncbi:MAG: hypothetical protein KKB51_03640 [Candidatus Riflebacteria bacterium]|nr:hypothetical protein [Candidatus Riflebacteria bacterium]